MAAATPPSAASAAAAADDAVATGAVGQTTLLRVRGVCLPPAAACACALPRSPPPRPRQVLESTAPLASERLGASTTAAYMEDTVAAVVPVVVAAANPHVPTFGKAFSSDVTGDGPAQQQQNGHEAKCGSSWFHDQTPGLQKSIDVFMANGKVAGGQCVRDAITAYVRAMLVVRKGIARQHLTAVPRWQHAPQSVDLPALRRTTQ